MDTISFCFAIITNVHVKLNYKQVSGFVPVATIDFH